jgi:hypothetical protein
MDYMIRHHERGIPQVPQQIAIESKWVEGTTLPEKLQTISKRRSQRPVAA